MESAPRRVSGIRLRLLRRVSGVRVWLVDGERVRDRLGIDFTMGGSHTSHRFIPRGEVWIERILSRHDREATIRHELAERALMLGGMGYDRAHDRANIAERRYR